MGTTVLCSIDFAGLRRAPSAFTVVLHFFHCIFLLSVFRTALCAAALLSAVSSSNDAEEADAIIAGSNESTVCCIGPNIDRCLPRQQPVQGMADSTYQLQRCCSSCASLCTCAYRFKPLVVQHAAPADNHKIHATASHDRVIAFSACNHALLQTFVIMLAMLLRCRACHSSKQRSLMHSSHCWPMASPPLIWLLCKPLQPKHLCPWCAASMTASS